MKKLILTMCIFYFSLFLTGCSNINIVKRKSNSYFYNADHIMLNAMAEYYELETSVKSNIEMEIYLVKEYDYGKLYKLEMKSIPLEDARKNMFFLCHR